MPSSRALLLLPVLLAAACTGSTTSERPSPVVGSTTSATPTPTTMARPEDPLSPRPALESPAPLGQPDCDAAALTVTDADAVVDDTTWTEIFVVRTTGAPCQLEGFPEVTLRAEDGQELVASPVGHVTPTLTLSRGTSVSFVLVTGRSGTCTPTTSLRVLLPGTHATLTATTTLAVCGRLEVHPVERRADDEGAEG